MMAAFSALVDAVARGFDARSEAIGKIGPELMAQVAHVGLLAAETMIGGHTIYAAGNGGSAAQAQHLVAELVGRFLGERPALPAVALTADSAVVTAIGNDYGFEAIFERQVQALVRPGDLLICWSTSGNSPNVIAAVREARRRQAKTVGFLGANGGRLATEVDIAIAVPATDTAQIQEMHLTLCHLVCGLVEQCLQTDGDR